MADIGVAQAWGELLGKDLAQRREYASELKMLSARIQMEQQQKQELFDYERFSPEITSGLGQLSGIGTQPGYRATPAEGGVLAGLGRTKETTRGRMGGNRKYDRNALIASTLKNPEIFDSLTPTAKADIFPDLQKGGFKYKGKPLGEGLQVRADSAKNALRAVDRINVKLSNNAQDFAKLYSPGSIGAKDLRGDLNEIMDVITRIRTGAALNRDEQTFYKAQLMSRDLSTLIDDLSDGSLDADTVNYRVNTIYKPYLEDAASMLERRKTSVVERPGEEKNPWGTRADVDNFLKERNRGRKP